MAGEAEAAAALGADGGGAGGDHLRGHQAALARELVDDLERLEDAFGGVDDDGHDRHPPAELEQSVAVGCVIAVEAPDAAQDGCAAGTGLPQPAHELGVNWMASMFR